MNDTELCQRLLISHLAVLPKTYPALCHHNEERIRFCVPNTKAMHVFHRCFLYQIALTDKLGLAVTHGAEPAKETEEGTLPDLELSETPGPVLIRATNGASKVDRDSRKIKFATVVEPEAIDMFYVRYAEVCKIGMTALKKRNRKNKNKKKKAPKAVKDAEGPAA